MLDAAAKAIEAHSAAAGIRAPYILVLFAEDGKAITKTNCPPSVIGGVAALLGAEARQQMAGQKAN